MSTAVYRSKRSKSYLFFYTKRGQDLLLHQNHNFLVTGKDLLRGEPSRFSDACARKLSGSNRDQGRVELQRDTK